MPVAKVSSSSKYHHVYSHLAEQIKSGALASGARLPTEVKLIKKFEVSRTTVIRALRNLEQEGLIQRKQGSGSFVRSTSSTTSVGLIIPGISVESIFAEVQRRILWQAVQLGWQVFPSDAAMPDAVDSAGHRPAEVAKRLVSRGIKGVMVVPYHVEGDGAKFNQQTLEIFAAAGVAVILLDRDIVDYPDRSSYDLISLDHEHSGIVIGRHLIKQGARRFAFVGESLQFPSTRARFSGLRTALQESRIALPDSSIFRGSLEDPAFGERLLAHKADAIVCDNDQDAAMMLRVITRAGLRVPEDVMLTGFDDRPVARLLTVPLTTVAQPVESMAAHAITILRMRMEQPSLAPTSVLVQGSLIERASTGAASAPVVGHPPA